MAGAKKAYRVCGPAVVLRTVDGSERYLYRDAPVGDGFTEESVKRAIANGLVEESDAPVLVDSEDDKAAADKAAADKKAADKAAADKAAAEAAAKK